MTLVEDLQVCTVYQVVVLPFFVLHRLFVCEQYLYKSNHVSSIHLQVDKFTNVE